LLTDPTLRGEAWAFAVLDIDGIREVGDGIMDTPRELQRPPAKLKGNR
jgi:hypothetical protein